MLTTFQESGLFFSLFTPSLLPRRLVIISKTSVSISSWPLIAAFFVWCLLQDREDLEVVEVLLWILVYIHTTNINSNKEQCQGLLMLNGFKWNQTCRSCFFGTFWGSHSFGTGKNILYARICCQKWISIVCFSRELEPISSPTQGSNRCWPKL